MNVVTSGFLETDGKANPRTPSKLEGPSTGPCFQKTGGGGKLGVSVEKRRRYSAKHKAEEKRLTNLTQSPRQFNKRKRLLLHRVLFANGDRIHAKGSRDLAASVFDQEEGPIALAHVGKGGGRSRIKKVLARTVPGLVRARVTWHP